MAAPRGGLLISRIRTAFLVYAFAALGVFLVAVPWSPVWETSTAGYLATSAGPWLRSGFLRGFVSGLGFLNLAAAWSEARSLLWPGAGGGREG
jgi:hypothetical protein